jgi:hypothetical protein
MAISFKIPKGYSAPEGVKEGVEFSEIGTFKFEGDEMTIITIGQDKTPVGSGKPKGAKAAIKEQLSSMKDKSGSDQMDEEEAAETPEEEASEDESME